MGEFSLPHIFIVLVIVFLVFGAKRLPEIGASLGQGIREFKKSVAEIGDTDDQPRTQRMEEPRRLQRLHRKTDPRRLSQ